MKLLDYLAQYCLIVSNSPAYQAKSFPCTCYLRTFEQKELKWGSYCMQIMGCTTVLSYYLLPGPATGGTMGTVVSGAQLEGGESAAQQGWMCHGA